MFSALQGANLSNTLCSTALHVGSPDHPIMMVVLVMTLSTMYDRKHSTVQSTSTQHLLPWVAWYNTWLIIELTSKGAVFSSLFSFSQHLLAPAPATTSPQNHNCHVSPR